MIEPSHRFQLMVPYVVAAAAGVIGMLLWAAHRGDRHAKWLLLGSAPVMVGSAFPLGRLTGLIPVSFWTTYGMQVGIAIELPTLLLILMMRGQRRREHQRRIQGMDRIDPATGLLNAPVFAERLTRMTARAKRLQHRGAVLLVEIVNIEQLRRAFGARSAEELPLRVAGRLLATAREIDDVGRLSPVRFGMLIEGPLTAAEAASIGPRVVARCLMPFRDKPAQWVARVRVAQASGAQRNVGGRRSAGPPGRAPHDGCPGQQAGRVHAADGVLAVGPGHSGWILASLASRTHLSTSEAM